MICQPVAVSAVQLAHTARQAAEEILDAVPAGLPGLEHERVAARRGDRIAGKVPRILSLNHKPADTGCNNG